MPIYLQAAGENFPQLKRVTGDKAVMEPPLDQAIDNLFVAQTPVPVFGKSPDGG